MSMTVYDSKRQSKIDRLEARVARLRAFAKGKDFSLFSEARSGIPLGQPIIIGHHSERRHLERLHRVLASGFNASEKADRLEQRIESIKNNRSIQIDNPDAKQLIERKIDSLHESIEHSKKINKILKKQGGDIGPAIEYFKTQTDVDSQYIVELLSGREGWYASKSLRMHFLSTTNQGAEIRRLKKRLVELERVSKGFEPFEINGVKVQLVDGQVQVEFEGKPDQATRDKIKRHPISLKWSSYSKCWVRKYTGSVGNYFICELKAALEGVTYDN